MRPGRDLAARDVLGAARVPLEDHGPPATGSSVKSTPPGPPRTMTWTRTAISARPSPSVRRPSAQPRRERALGPRRCEAALDVLEEASVAGHVEEAVEVPRERARLAVLGGRRGADGHARRRAGAGAERPVGLEDRLAHGRRERDRRDLGRDRRRDLREAGRLARLGRPQARRDRRAERAARRVGRREEGAEHRRRHDEPVGDRELGRQRLREPRRLGAARGRGSPRNPARSGITLAGDRRRR